jgi:hypothetical protein
MTTITRSTKLSSYAALAAAALPATAGAEIVSETGLSVVDPGLIDFGPGFGDVFGLFSFAGGNRPNLSSLAAIVWPQNFFSTSLNNVHRASFVPDGGRPANLASGYSVGSGAQWQGIGGTSTYYPGVPPIFSGSDGMSWIGPRDNMLALRNGQVDCSFGGGTNWQTPSGPWAPSASGFLGFRFSTDHGANFHYGWFELDVALAAKTGSLTLKGWAFEDEPNVPVTTPTPAAGGLALLAMGAAGIRRSRRTAA